MSTLAHMGHVGQQYGVRSTMGAFVLAIVVVVVGLLSVPPQPASAAATTSWRLSVYDGVGNTAGVASTTTMLGQSAAFGSDYFDGKSWAGIDNDAWLIQRWHNTGLRMIWGVPMLPTGGGVSLAVGATGAYNSYFATLATNLVAGGMASSTLRLGWEFNSQSFPWYAAGQAPAFVAYWQQIVNTMRSVPGAHFSFEWNANRGGQGPSDKAMGNFDNYYPGDSYVDVVALDVYDQAWNTYPGVAQQFQDILTLPWGLNWITSLGAAHGKPVAIPELGLGHGPSAPNSGVASAPGPVCGGDNPTFVTDVLTWAATQNVGDIVFWDYGTSSIDSGRNPKTAEALHQAVSPGAPPLPTPPGTNGGNTSDQGYWLVGADGGIFAYGNAGFFGSTGALRLNRPITGMAVTPDRHGYWLAASDGGIFSFGNAGFFGSTGNITLNSPVIGTTSTPDGQGYWLAAADGGIFAFGDAGFYGSTGGIRLNSPIIGMATTPNGRGYWLAAADGGIFAFGDAGFYGSTGDLHLNSPIVAMASTPDGGGYWLAASDGGIFAFGDAGFYGSTGGIRLNNPIVGIAATPDSQGYWLAAADGGIFAFGDAAFHGSAGAVGVRSPITGVR